MPGPLKALLAGLVVLLAAGGIVAFLRSRPVAPPAVGAVQAIAGNVARASNARPDKPKPARPKETAEQCDDDSAERHQIESALVAGEGYVREKARTAAKGAAIWYPIGACYYTGRYEILQRDKKKIRASMEFICEGWDDERTGQARTSSVWWPAHLMWDGYQWVWDPSSKLTGAN